MILQNLHPLLSRTCKLHTMVQQVQQAQQAQQAQPAQPAQPAQQAQQAVLPRWAAVRAITWFGMQIQVHGVSAPPAYSLVAMPGKLVQVVLMRLLLVQMRGKQDKVILQLPSGLMPGKPGNVLQQLQSVPVRAHQTKARTLLPSVTRPPQPDNPLIALY